MVSQRELETIVADMNVIFANLDKRIKLLESTQDSLLHDIKDMIQEKPKVKRAKKNG
tara:strand:+ start:4524 stop:4694 length:171 start_codon:yes stop_codon:yes gene_type:complete